MNLSNTPRPNARIDSCDATPAFRANWTVKFHLVAGLRLCDSTERTREPRKQISKAQPFKLDRVSDGNLLENIEIRPLNSHGEELEFLVRFTFVHQTGCILPGIC